MPGLIGTRFRIRTRILHCATGPTAKQLHRRCFLLACIEPTLLFLLLSFFLSFFSILFSLPPSLPRFNFLRVRVTLPSYLNRMDVSTVSFLPRPFATFDGDEIAQVQLIDDIALLPFYIRTVRVSHRRGGKSWFLYILFECKFNKARFVIGTQFFYVMSLYG